MIRNFKFFGVAVTALLAMSAMAVSSASADTFQSEENKVVTLTGSQEGTDVFTVQAGEVKCSSVKYTGTQATSPETTIKAKPTYSGCTFAGLAATVNTGVCEYVFHINDAAGDTTGTADIVCTSGEITVTAPSVGTAKCIVHVPPQNGLKTVTYKNVAGVGPTREITVEANLSEITYSQTKGTAETGNCATEDSKKTGTYVGKALVTGEEDKAEKPNHIGIFLV